MKMPAWLTDFEVRATLSPLPLWKWRRLWFGRDAGYLGVGVGPLELRMWWRGTSSL